jgi:hypothetical protein
LTSVDLCTIREIALAVGLFGDLSGGVKGLQVSGMFAVSLEGVCGGQISSVAHGGTRTYSIYGVGATARSGRAALALAFGLGVHVLAPRPVFVDSDAIGSNLLAFKTASQPFDHISLVQVRVPVGIQLQHGISVFIAPALNVSIVESDSSLLDPSPIGSKRLTTATAPVTVRLWPGFSAGFRFF